MEGNHALNENAIAIFADYSQNFKRISTLNGFVEQYRDHPETSLLNLPCFVHSSNETR